MALTQSSLETDRQAVVQNPVGDFRTLSTRHVKRVTHDDIIFITYDLFKLSSKLL